MRVGQISTFLVLLAFAGFILGIVDEASAVMLVSRADEVKIGKRVEQETIKEYGGVSTDAVLNERVERVGKLVAAVSPRKDVTYTYKVVNSDVVNAFAAPGGPVVITKKLAQMLSADDELAFVLAHETGHIAAQHGRKAINRAILASGVAYLLFRKSGESVQTGVNVMYTLYDRGYSRDQEYEADSYGVTLARAAGFNNEGAISALAKLGLKRAKGVDKYFATHPDTPDRINRVAQLAGIAKERVEQIVQEVQAHANANARRQK